MYYFYVLYSRGSGVLYKGFSSRLKVRINEHKEGKVRSTRHVSDWDLVYYEAFVSKKDALREEKFLKSGKGRERLQYMLVSSLL